MDRVRAGVIGLGVGRHDVHGHADCERAELMAEFVPHASRIDRLARDVEWRWWDTGLLSDHCPFHARGRL